jgi:hypothetical protein
MVGVDRRGGAERMLVGVSLAQLACGLAGMGVAIRRGHAYDVGSMRGSPEQVARDAIFPGTALSAPVPMQAIQAGLTAVVAGRGSQVAISGLRALGVIMTGGYLAERLVRHRLRPRGWDIVESPLVALGLGLAVAMILLGQRARRIQEPARGGRRDPVRRRQRRATSAGAVSPAGLTAHQRVR